MAMSRASGPLAIDDELAGSLGLWRLRNGIHGPPILSVGPVREVEKQLGAQLPDDVWAYLAGCCLQPHQVLTLTEDGYDLAAVPRRFVAFERASGSYFCVSRCVAPKAVQRVVQWSNTNPGTNHWSDVAAFLEWRLESLPASGDAADGAPLPRCQPVLVDPASEPLVRRVLHPTFGEGEVLQCIPGSVPKLVIDFGPLGHKKILSTFVTDLPYQAVAASAARAPGRRRRRRSAGARQ